MSKLLINPYKVGPPVMGADFYGRSELLSKVQKALQTSNVVLLQGQRRIGKTSFLKQLSVFLKSAEGMQAFQAPLVPVIFDIQRYVQDTLPQFQWHLAEAIARALQLTAPSLPEWETNHALFQDVWLPQVYEKLGDRDLVILVDEFDNLEGQEAPQAMQTLIPFLGQLVSSETRLKWVLTSGRQAGKLPIQCAQIVSVGRSFPMSFLSWTETRELIEAPAGEYLTYQPESIDRIYELTNGQPHLTQALGSEIFQHMLSEERVIVRPTDVDEAVPRVLEVFSGAIASILKVPPLEERVLAAIAWLTKNCTTATKSEIINLLLEHNIELNIDELKRILKDLTEWDLLTEKSQELKISVELLRLWMARNLSVAAQPEQVKNILYELAQNSFELAEQFFQASRYDLAVKQYKVALDYVPNHCEALRKLAESYRLIEDIENRVNTLRRLCEFEPENSNELIRSLANYADLLVKQKDFPTAIRQYKEILKLNKSIEVQKGLIQALMDELILQAEKLDKTPYSNELTISEISKEIDKGIDDLTYFFVLIRDLLEKEELQVLIKCLFHVEIKIQDVSSKIKDKKLLNTLTVYSRLDEDSLLRKELERALSAVLFKNLSCQVILYLPFFAASVCSALLISPLVALIILPFAIPVSFVFVICLMFIILFPLLSYNHKLWAIGDELRTGKTLFFS